MASTARRVLEREGEEARQETLSLRARLSSVSAEFEGERRAWGARLAAALHSDEEDEEQVCVRVTCVHRPLLELAVYSILVASSFIFYMLQLFLWLSKGFYLLLRCV